MKNKLRKRGGAMLLILITMVVLMIVLSASMRFIARQSHQTTDQEQREQSFGLADVAVEHTRWLLNRSVGKRYFPSELLSNPPQTAMNHFVRDENGKIIGMFTIQFLEAKDSEGYLKIRTTGYDSMKKDLCQVIEARIKRFKSGEYKVIDRNHLSGYPCEEPINNCVPYRLALGQEVSGKLGEDDCKSQFQIGDTYADVFIFTNNSDKPVQVNVASDDFSPYVTLVELGGQSARSTNSCSLGGACIDNDGVSGVTLEEGKTYQIEVVADSNSQSKLGNYTLHVFNPSEQ